MPRSARTSLTSMLALSFHMVAFIGSAANAGLSCVLPLDGADSGYVSKIAKLTDGGALMLAEQGLFRIDATSWQVLPVGGAETGILFDLEHAGDVVLILAERGLFRFDSASGLVIASGNVETGRAYHIVELERGGALLRAERGLFRLDEALGQVVAVGGAWSAP